MTLDELKTDVNLQVSENPDNWKEIVNEHVNAVPAERLGQLILNADSSATPCQVKCRVELPRYSPNWEQHFRDLLRGIIIVALNLDQLD